LYNKRTILDDEKREKRGKRTDTLFNQMRHIICMDYYEHAKTLNSLKVIIKFLPGEQHIDSWASRIASPSLSLSRTYSSFKVKYLNVLTHKIYANCFSPHANEQAHYTTSQTT
jgi:hypothetical protein